MLGRDSGYRPINPRWPFLFNSYYQTIGPMHPRSHRGLLSRPTLAEVLDYRARVDERMEKLFDRSGDPELDHLVALGLNHEQQQ